MSFWLEEKEEPAKARSRGRGGLTGRLNVKILKKRGLFLDKDKTGLGVFSH